MKNQRFEKEKNYDRNDRNERGGDRNFHNKHHFKKRQNKSLIVIKSTVFALSIVLATLLLAFTVFKVKGKEMSNIANASFTKKCSEKKAISVDEKVSEVSFSDDKIVLLGSVSKSGKQEVVIVDSHCGSEISRVNISVKND